MPNTTNYAKAYLQDIVENFPGGTSDTIAASRFTDCAQTRVWIDGAWYSIRVQICDPQPTDLALPEVDF